MKKIFILVIVFILISNSKVCAIENDFGLWPGITVTAPVTEKLLTRFYISPRLLDNATDFNQLILHGFIGYKFNEHFTLWQGYAWSTTYIPHFRREQRIYNDAVLENKIKKLTLENRFRFEERFLQSVDGVSLRGRYRLRGAYPITKDNKWSLVLYDELFFNTNSPKNGPSSGLDQNRIYLGINKKINDFFSIDGGYLLQHSIRKNRADLLNHFALVNLNFNVPLYSE